MSKNQQPGVLMSQLQQLELWPRALSYHKVLTIISISQSREERVVRLMWSRLVSRADKKISNPGQGRRSQ